MELFEITMKADESDFAIIGIRVPCHFQWSLLEIFRQQIPSRIIIPLFTGMSTNEIYEIIETHQKYFPTERLALLYDDHRLNYEIKKEYILY